MKHLATVGLLVLALMMPGAVQAQAVTRHPQPDATLAQKWTWAAGQAAQPAYRDGYWIGYSIERLMGERSFIGAWSTRQPRKSLHELIHGVKPTFDPFAMQKRHADDGAERKVVKEVALLFGFERGAAQPSKVRVSDLSGQVDLEGRPLLWLGGASDAESLALVQQHYARAGSVDRKENLLMAAAVHEATAPVVSFLAEVLTGREDDDLREKAAFWLGQQDDATALGILKGVAQGDRSTEVREQAVFGISQVALPAATEVLIDLARTGQGDVCKQAIFWLGQQASKRAVEALGGIVRDDPDTEVQKQAVFALTQLPDDQAVPLLIDIARTHRKAAVRKQAIFWLGQSDDPRALEALIELARS